ncbi:MAG: DUF1302 domain-containing protein [Pseudomonadota bacterium]
MKKKLMHKSYLAVAVASILFSGTGNAAEFYFGEDEDIVLQITSTLSVGASWRIEDADPALISGINGGSGVSNTSDDGNLNFEKNDTYSKIIKGLHDINLSKDNIGAFLRFRYWYDKELNDESRPHGHVNNSYSANTPLNDDGFSDFGQFSGIEVLDAYAYGTFDWGEVPIDVRIGRQVISWGESTFIQGGINTTNPFDVSALRRPGAELKEGLLPVGMVYVNAGVTENLSIEAYYQYEWEKTQVDGCGTLFSTSDFVADGCNAVVVGSGFFLDDFEALQFGFAPVRSPDLEPDDGGQYGLAFRYYSPELNDTEFGFYFLNFHSRLPLISGLGPRWTEFADIPFLPWINAAQAFESFQMNPDPVNNSLGALLVQLGINDDRAAVDAFNPQYFIEFPEDLKLYGASFATNVGGVALSGEISYKPDTPIQVNGNHLLSAALTQNPLLPFTQRVVDAGPGGRIQGWDPFDVTQIQVTALSFFDQVLGASRLTFIAEAGVVLTDGIEDAADERGLFYGRNTLFGLTLPFADLDGGGFEGHVTDTAWGYRMRAQFEYPNAIGGVALTPTISWNHDVDGYSPEPGQQFNEGQKSLGLSLEAVYQNNYSMSISYRQFTGGDFSVLSDKDFISVSFGLTY